MSLLESSNNISKHQLPYLAISYDVSYYLQENKGRGGGGGEGGASIIAVAHLSLA